MPQPAEPANNLEASTASTAANEDRLYIVGIGASAGGLEALRELAKNLPAALQAAYIVAQHMSPLHKSLLPELIGRETHLDVVDVVDGMIPEANKIYVTPPRSDVVLREGRLTLLPPKEDASTPKPSVDRLLISLASEVGEHAVAVVLSGTGSDGAYGVQSVRGAGGITIAQSEETSKYDGMPSAAVATGCIDLVMSPAEMGSKLNRILTTSRNFEAFATREGPSTPISDLLQILLARTRVDFRDYKNSTVGRRIERRMTALEIGTLEEYTTFCRTRPFEVDALFKDLLISVTWFFRDRNEFDDLETVIHELVKNREKDQRLRILVAGCATGEEVYSIAMVLAEALGGMSKLNRNLVQIFATDIDRAAIQVAREGIYSNAALDNIPEELAEKYLVCDKERFQIAAPLRDIVLFSEHNVCQDPPFLNLDLICCRNLLIYFNGDLQQRVLARFHYGLKANGYLFLGKAESVSGSDDMFKSSSDSARIFRKRFLSARENRPLPRDLGGNLSRNTLTPINVEPRAKAVETNERRMFDALARSVCKNGILVSSDYRILRVFGDMGPHIALTEKSRLQVGLNMLRPHLAHEARLLVNLAISNSEPRTGQTHKSETTPVVRTKLEAIPITSAELDETFVLIAFKHWEQEEDQNSTVTLDTTPVEIGRVRELEDEIGHMRDALQQTTEELETSNEELQATNEELQSMNEEIQATNEELEISNEELQSTNEELVTVNEELHVNSSELTTVNQELISVLENIAAPILVLDSAFGISKASKAAELLFGLARPLEQPHVSQCRLPDGFPNLPEICNEALRLGQPIKLDIVGDDIPYILHCAPYSDQRGQLCGVTMLFVEQLSEPTSLVRLKTD